MLHFNQQVREWSTDSKGGHKDGKKEMSFRKCQQLVLGLHSCGRGRMDAALRKCRHGKESEAESRPGGKGHDPGGAGHSGGCNQTDHERH